MWYIYTIEYYSAIKKWNIAICSNMDGPKDYRTKSEKDIYDITYMWNLKNNANESTYKQPHRHGKQTYGYQRGKGGREG